jgi:uncharacterized protein (DUF934 family)
MARSLVRNSQIVEDTLLDVADDAPIPADAAQVSVSLKRWLSEFASGESAANVQAVVVRGGDDVRTLADSLGQLSVIVIEFPKFGDGRGYSHARILREQLRFSGELRARGDVLRDQAFYLKRCGFTAFEPRDPAQLAGIIEAFRDFSVVYQGAADQPLPAWRRYALPTAALKATDSPTV